MFKKYFSNLLFFKKRNNTLQRYRRWRKKFIPSFLEKKAPIRKYQKRKKNIFQKLWKKLDILPYISRKNTLFIWTWSIIIIICILLFYSPLISIKNINIYREWSLIDINRAYRQVDYIRWTNTLRLNTLEIAQRLQKSQISLSEIKIDVQFPDTVNIFLDTYEVSFQTDVFFILSNGSIVEKENDIFPEIPYILLSDDLQEYVDFQKTLKAREILAIQNLISESEKNILWFSVSQVYYFIKEREVFLQDTQWTLYIFDIGANISSQLRKLAIYKKGWANSQIPYVYIDVRVPEKIFLCWRESLNTCNSNITDIYGEDVIQSLLEGSSLSQQ